jgi:hypothetical protein
LGITGARCPQQKGDETSVCYKGRNLLKQFVDSLDVPFDGKTVQGRMTAEYMEDEKIKRVLDGYCYLARPYESLSMTKIWERDNVTLDIQNLKPFANSPANAPMCAD